MNDWDATNYEAKDNLLRLVRLEAEAMFEMAEAADRWTAPTACPKWEVRDIVGHLIDVTESYFTGFHAAATGGQARRAARREGHAGAPRRGRQGPIAS